ncbi:hypothetical protein BU17DRAFT_66505 [Hysterangium stoloniferum]|nr:hypothetical protein BU17DRAFT_66505 [Hysterangium stoloniferum]
MLVAMGSHPTTEIKQQVIANPIECTSKTTCAERAILETPGRRGASSSSLTTSAAVWRAGTLPKGSAVTTGGDVVGVTGGQVLEVEQHHDGWKMDVRQGHLRGPCKGLYASRSSSEVPGLSLIYDPAQLPIDIEIWGCDYTVMAFEKNDPAGPLAADNHYIGSLTRTRFIDASFGFIQAVVYYMFQEDPSQSKILPVFDMASAILYALRFDVFRVPFSLNGSGVLPSHIHNDLHHSPKTRTPYKCYFHVNYPLNIIGGIGQKTRVSVGGRHVPQDDNLRDNAQRKYFSQISSNNQYFFGRPSGKYFNNN